MFNDLLKLIDGVDLVITIRKTIDSKLAVTVLPKKNGLKDDAQVLIPPAVLTGTADELDANFIQVLSQGIPQANGLLNNMKRYELQLAEVAANSKAELAKKEAAKKAKEERKTKFDEFVKKAETLETEGKTEDAIKFYRVAKNFTDTPEEIEKKLAKLQQPTLF